jgi:cytochrome oxidase Cu insertion factor (SCO1/SenC/PrrC family)
MTDQKTDAGSPEAPGGEAPAAGARRSRMLLAAGLAAVVVAGAAAAGAVALNRTHGSQLHRPSGIPASVSNGQINLMGLAPVPGAAAPGFTLTDQQGRTLSLASLRGKAVILQFMDPHCTDICPIVSAEYVDAYHDLGTLASRVVFVAINVNQYHAAVSDMMAYSREQRLITIPDWHFFTGPVPALRTVWGDYHVEVQAPNPNADIVHTSVIYFIGPDGRERFLALPMADHTASGASYLPAGQISAWGQGIAQVARTLVG